MEESLFECKKLCDYLWLILWHADGCQPLQSMQVEGFRPWQKMVCAFQHWVLGCMCILRACDLFVGRQLHSCSCCVKRNQISTSILNSQVWNKQLKIAYMYFGTSLSWLCCQLGGLPSIQCGNGGLKLVSVVKKSNEQKWGKGLKLDKSLFLF